jgi:hypothetical protein
MPCVFGFCEDINGPVGVKEEKTRYSQFGMT